MIEKTKTDVLLFRNTSVFMVDGKELESLTLCTSSRCSTS